MKKIAVFAGTTEGRRIAEFLEDFPAQVFISIATEYGRDSLGTYRNAQVLCGRMEQGQMEVFLEQNQIGLVVDATHPFAKIVTENLRNACQSCRTEYIRCLRDAMPAGQGIVEGAAVEDYMADGYMREGSPEGIPKVVTVGCVQEVVAFLKKTSGNILIATGSKELKEYTAIPDHRNRCYARVLSTEQAVLDSTALGFEGKHLIAMQGPFSKEMNAALLRHVGAAYFVTKESGKAGGFPEKLEAAAEAGAVLVVIARPEEDGMTLAEVKTFLGNWLRSDGKECRYREQPDNRRT